MLPHVAWHIPRPTLHMQELSSSHVDSDVYANWHCFWQVLFWKIHCESEAQSAWLSFSEQRRLHWLA